MPKVLGRDVGRWATLGQETQGGIMANDIAERIAVPVDLQEKVLLGGDLSQLTASERLSYYNHVCN